MRTNIVIDPRLMRKALECTGLRTKRAAVEAGLRLLVQVHGQSRIRSVKGKVVWEGDLDERRVGRV